MLSNTSNFEKKRPGIRHVNSSIGYSSNGKRGGPKAAPITKQTEGGIAKRHDPILTFASVSTSAFITTMSRQPHTDVITVRKLVMSEQLPVTSLLVSGIWRGDW